MPQVNREDCAGDVDVGVGSACGGGFGRRSVAVPESGSRLAPEVQDVIAQVEEELIVAILHRAEPVALALTIVVDERPGGTEVESDRSAGVCDDVVDPRVNEVKEAS